MSQQTEVGKLIAEGQERDAIHIAIAPVIATETLHPSQLIGFVEPGNIENVGTVAEPIGIVDPFLREMAFPGERFWMFLFPQSITSLKHNWTHPAFVEAKIPSKEPSRRWMEEYASNLNMTYQEVLDAAYSWQENGDYLCDGGKFEGEYLPEGFWDHWQVLTGRLAKDRGSFFSCSC